MILIQITSSFSMFAVADDLWEITKHHFADFQTHLLQKTSFEADEQLQQQPAPTQQYGGYQQQLGSPAGAASQVQYGSGRSRLTQRVVPPY